MSESDDTTTTAPVVEVVSGSPSAEEVAAILTVLSATTATGAPVGDPAGDRPRAGGWKSYWRTVRREHRPGPGAWVSGQR